MGLQSEFATITRSTHMSDDQAQHPAPGEPGFEPPIELLEIDEDIAPRPEEEIADASRAAPDPH